MADYFFGPLSYFDPAPWQELFLGAGVMLALGAWDDMRPLKASTKFLVQLGAAGRAIGLGFQYGLFLGATLLASVVGLRKLGYRELEVMRRGLAPGSGPGQALGIFELPVLAHPFFHPFFDLAMAAAAGLTGPSS